MRAGQSEYRIVKGYGGALRVQEAMHLNDDEQAREWYWRRWGNDDKARIQRKSDGAWVSVDRAVLA
jgi:hypothetical protein